MAKQHSTKPTAGQPLTSAPAPIVYNDEDYTVVTDGSGRQVALVPTAAGLLKGLQVQHL